jgi:hypothetical protein
MPIEGDPRVRWKLGWIGEREPGMLLSCAPRRCWSCCPGDRGLGLSVIGGPPWLNMFA